MQLSNEVERLRREGASAQQQLDNVLSELGETRAALAKREKELSDFQRVRDIELCCIPE